MSRRQTTRSIVQFIPLRYIKNADGITHEYATEIYAAFVLA